MLLIISDDRVAMSWQAIVLRVCLAIFLLHIKVKKDGKRCAYNILICILLTINVCILIVFQSIKSVYSLCLQTDNHAAEAWGPSYSRNIQHKNDITQEGLL